MFAFGSVPLKTFLPDGDIDLTALTHQKLEEDLARDICSFLQNDMHDPEFIVQDVQYIPAQVKIVKCTVNDIPVDISFNQMAGLSTLCFLEKVDELIGKDHLFKRSIILIKAWCYYESRILGAPHGLISTYALEVMVLHILNIFHMSLCGPLAVLCKFLDYYSKFDWDNYYVSINGPVALSSLAESVEETPKSCGEDLLLTQEFLRYSRETYSDPIQTQEISSRDFPIKHLNIMDPLKSNNNLGRSVSQGNFYRIKYAFSYGAERLWEALKLPGESMGMALEKFFVNSLDRNGKGQRADAQVPVPAFGTGRSEASDLGGDYSNLYYSMQYGHWYHNYTLYLNSCSSPLSSPSSQTYNESPWDGVRQLLRSMTHPFYQNDQDVYYQRPLVCHPYASQVPITTNGTDGMVRSRGTGTYIPETAHVYQSYRDARPCPKPRPRKQEYSYRGFRKLPGKTERAKEPTEKESSAAGLSVEFSLEHFPLLPSIKRCTQLTLNTHQDQSFSSPRSLDGIKFGTFKDPLVKTAGSELSPKAVSIPYIPSSNEERVNAVPLRNCRVNAVPLRLEDEGDFPPLPMMAMFAERLRISRNNSRNMEASSASSP